MEPEEYEEYEEHKLGLAGEVGGRRTKLEEDGLGDGLAGGLKGVSRKVGGVCILPCAVEFVVKIIAQLFEIRVVSSRLAVAHVCHLMCLSLIRRHSTGQR